MPSLLAMLKQLITIFKIRVKTTGMPLKNGLFSVSFGHLVVHLMKLEEKPLIPFSEISNQYSLEIILSSITTSTLIKTNGKAGKKKSIISTGSLL